MDIKGSFFGIACRTAALSFLVAGSASLLQAQQSLSTDSTPKTPLLMASSSSPLDLMSAGSSSSSSSDVNGEFLLGAAAKDSAQPPPRRYGRPNYSDSHSNPDGSSKFAFVVGAGAAMPVGNTHYYETPSYDFQVGVGRNWSKSFGVMMQFDYDHFGLQGATLANQEYIYNYGCPAGTVAAGTCGVQALDGNNHVWSFTLNPTFTLATEGSMGAYLVLGGGFYHKVTDFSIPTTQIECTYYGCGYYNVDETVDDYTSNAGGVNAGLGLTWKVSKFSNEKFYLEGRYVVVLNSQRYGYTARNVATTTYNGYDAYPANSNRTTYVPITVGLRF